MSTTRTTMENTFSYGDYYGYPSCCIQSFHKVLLGTESISILQLEVGRGTGFIPCKNHTHKIKTGECTLEQIILPTRKCTSAFPDGKGQLKIKIKEPSN